MNGSPHFLHGCETRARSRSDDFTVQRMEHYASITHILSKIITFVDLSLDHHLGSSSVCLLNIRDDGSCSVYEAFYSNSPRWLSG